MKKILVLIFIFTIQLTVFAEDIYLNNGEIIKGKVLRFNEEKLEYDPEGGKPFAIVEISKVEKIVYSDGSERKFRISQASRNEKKKPVDEKTLQNRFYNSNFRIGLLLGGGPIYGDIDEQESEIYNNSSYKEHDKQIVTDMWYTGIECDIFIPGLSTSYSIGLKTRLLETYGREFLRKTYIASTADEGEFEDTKNVNQTELFTYKSLQVGPVFNFIMNPNNDYIHFVIQNYYLFGKIFDGHLDSQAVLRDKGASIPKSGYYRKFNGYSATAGLGFMFVINRGLPLTIGLNLNYIYNKLNFDKKLEAYKSSETSFYGWQIELSAGIHF